MNIMDFNINNLMNINPEEKSETGLNSPKVEEELCEKLEIKEESVLGGNEEDDDSDSDLELSKVKERIRSKGQVLYMDKSGQDDEDSCYESVVLATYTSTIVKEELEEDLKTVFKENNLEFEKRKFYQNIAERIVDRSDQIKLKELQMQYICQLREVANTEIFTCSSCPYQTISMINLKCHLLIVHNKKLMHKIFRCKTCKFEHDHRLAMRKHLSIHRNAEPESIYNCHLCGYIGPSKRALKSHNKKQHTKETTPHCDLCGYEAKTSADLKKHMGTHRVAGSHRYKCFKCEHEVANKMKMARHLLKVHKIDNERMHKLQNIKCDVCDYKTDSVHRLKQHALIHKNPEEIDYFYCEKCNFKCKLKHGLKKHVLVMHTDKSERVYSQMCDKCSYKCERPSMLKLHMLSHMDKHELSEAELHKCPHCPFKGKTKGNLKSHMYSHSDKTFKCDLCGFETKRQRNYKEHSKLHMKSTELKIFKCEFCPYQTKFKPCLVNHMKQGDHTGKNLKHIPHKFRIENADKPDFDPTEVRFGPPKKYPKYPRKDKKPEQSSTQHGVVSNGWGEDVGQNVTGLSNAPGDIFFNFMTGNTRF